MGDWRRQSREEKVGKLGVISGGVLGEAQVGPDPSDRAELSYLGPWCGTKRGDGHGGGCINSVSPCGGEKRVAGAFPKMPVLLLEAKVRRSLGWPENGQKDARGLGRDVCCVCGRRSVVWDWAVCSLSLLLAFRS